MMDRFQILGQMAMVLLALTLAAPATYGATQVLLEEQSLYSTVVVKKSGSLICLLFTVREDQRNQSCINQKRPRQMVFGYTRMTMTGLLFQPEPQRILVVGLGGGTLPQAFVDLFPGAKVDSIEIDPAVLKVAQTYFGFTPSDRNRVHTQDARIWVKRAALKQQKFDLIVLDAFNGEYIPEHLMTVEFLREVQQLIADDGVLISNTFAISDLYDHESTTYSAVFGEFINFQVPESANRVVIWPKVDVSDELLKERSELLAARLRPYAVPIQRYARLIKRQRGAKPDWDTAAKELTDQYAPANLLQNSD